MWGPQGARLLGASCDVVVVVDVMSFSTAVVVALERGASVYPYRWRDGSAAAFAKKHNARLAGSRHEGGLSLSPVSLQTLRVGEAIVLPSPNGSTLSFLTGGALTIAGCVRNASACARAAMNHGQTIGVAAAGERWKDDDSLRPAYEDLVGAGAILRRLEGNPSPECRSAIAAFQEARSTLSARLLTCVGGRELASLGYEKDIELIAAHDASSVVPVLVDGRFESRPIA